MGMGDGGLGTHKGCPYTPRDANAGVIPVFVGCGDQEDNQGRIQDSPLRVTFPSPLVGEGQDEGDTFRLTLTSVLSPQGRGGRSVGADLCVCPDVGTLSSYHGAHTQVRPYDAESVGTKTVGAGLVPAGWSSMGMGDGGLGTHKGYPYST